MHAETCLNGVTKLIDVIGSNDFAADFFSAINSMVPIDHCTVFMSDAGSVRTVIAQARSATANRQVQHLADAYSNSAYRDDPVWSSIDAQPACWVILPSALPDANYRREFYDKPNILEEVAVSGVSGPRRVYISYYRERGHARFSRDEIDRLTACAHPTIAVLGKHVELASRAPAPPTPSAPVSRDELYRRVQVAIHDENPALTKREAEICAGIVLGYTVLGLSLNLGISMNTVATHRKRAYAKLKVSSQNELFAHYFGMVEALKA